ncbi:unnamed protein product [Prorocentrum cordatum]|uniref:Uncharacterized protein n=1 Tax=Prorocentrum cordatum TaxID=2364126 RepID=A0ABN9VD25_9DINO|nr:unnamed protein product [Polarella glacialis]
MPNLTRREGAAACAMRSAGRAARRTAAAASLAGLLPTALQGLPCAAGAERPGGVLLGSDVLGPLCFDEDLQGPDGAREMREACCGGGQSASCWDGFYSPERCCRGGDGAFRARAQLARERLVRCMRGEEGEIESAGFFERATHYSVRPDQKLGRAAWCTARRADVSSALDLYAGEGGGVELLASGLRGTPGGRVLTFEYTASTGRSGSSCGRGWSPTACGCCGRRWRGPRRPPAGPPR